MNILHTMVNWYTNTTISKATINFTGPVSQPVLAQSLNRSQPCLVQSLSMKNPSPGISILLEIWSV